MSVDGSGAGHGSGQPGWPHPVASHPRVCHEGLSPSEGHQIIVSSAYDYPRRHGPYASYNPILPEPTEGQQTTFWTADRQMFLYPPIDCLLRLEPAAGCRTNL